MTWGLGNISASISSKTSGTTAVVVTGAIGEVGNVLVVFAAGDNIGTLDGDRGEITGVSDSVGNTYTKALQDTNSRGAAAGGATSAIYYSILTTQISATGTVTVTWASAITAKAAIVQEFTFGAGSTISVDGANIARDVNIDPSAVTLSGLTSGEYLFAHACAHEGPIADVLTNSTNYTGDGKDGTTGGSGVTNMTCGAEHRIFTGTGDTVDMGWAAADQSQSYVALREVVVSGPATELILAAHVNNNGGWYVVEVDSDTPDIDGFWGGTIADATTTLDNTWVLFTTAVMQDPEVVGSFDTSDDYAHGDHGPEDPWWFNVYGFPDLNAFVPVLFPPSQAEPIETFAAQPTFTEHPHECWYPTEQTSEDLHNPTVFDASTVVADVPVSASDTLAIAITDTASVLKLEGIEGLTAAGYSTFQGDVEPLEPPQPTTELANDTALDTAFVFADRQVASSDTLAVAITDIASVQAFESIEGLVAAQPTEPHPVDAYIPQEQTVEDWGQVTSLDVSALTPTPSGGEPIETFAARPLPEHVAALFPPQEDALFDYQSTSTLDVTWFFAGAPTQEPDETFAAQPQLGEAFWEATPTEDYTPHASLDTAFIVADVPVAAADSLGIAITDTASVSIIEGIEQLVGAQPQLGDIPDALIPLDDHPGNWEAISALDVSALTPSVAGEAVETFAAQPHYGEASWEDTPTEDYTPYAALDMAWFLTTEPKAASDTLGIALSDTATVEAFEGVAVLIAALPTEPYSVDTYIPFIQTVEDWANLTTLDVSALTPDGTPPPPVGTPVRDPQAKLTGALAEVGLTSADGKAVLTEDEGKAVLTETEGKAILTDTEGKADLL